MNDNIDHITISRNQLDELEAFCLKMTKEACGILMGKKDQDSGLLIERYIVDPNPLDQTWTSVTRVTKNIYPKYQEILNQTSDTEYVGEWHSHGSQEADYSRSDIKVMKFLIGHPKYGAPKVLVLGIIAQEESRFWLFSKEGKIRELKVIFQDSRI